MTKDHIIFDLIQQEYNRQHEGIELIASENFVSEQVMQAMGSVLTNKYAEGYPGNRYYGGCQVVDKVEQLAIDRAKQVVDKVEQLAIDRAKTLFGAAYANVQPHSGAQANAAVFFACLKPGDTFMGLDLSHGGHLSHGSPVNLSGINYNAIHYHVKEATGRVDYDEMAQLALQHKPKLIVAGASAHSRDWDFPRMRQIADSVGALLMADIAHPAGLIAAGLLSNPIPHCHIVTTTTHKTLRGPRGGLILMGQDFPNPWGITTPKGEIKMMSAVLDFAVFPGQQGGPLEHVIAAKAVAFGEALTDEYKAYMHQTQKNAAVMAETFTKLGYKVISGGTDNHSMLIDLRTKFPDISGKKVENTLVKADITINKNMVPFDSRTPFTTSGLRVGTPAITTRGLKEEHMAMIVEMIDTVISNIDNEEVIAQTRRKVNELMKQFPMFAW